MGNDAGCDCRVSLQDFRMLFTPLFHRYPSLRLTRSNSRKAGFRPNSRIAAATAVLGKAQQNRPLGRPVGLLALTLRARTRMAALGSRCTYATRRALRKGVQPLDTHANSDRLSPIVTKRPAHALRRLFNDRREIRGRANFEGALPRTDEGTVNPIAQRFRACARGQILTNVEAVARRQKPRPSRLEALAT